MINVTSKLVTLLVSWMAHGKRITSAAIISHCAASDAMSNPRNMIKKSLLLSTIMAAKDIRQWRTIVVRKNAMDDAAAQATRRTRETRGVGGHPASGAC